MLNWKPMTDEEQFSFFQYNGIFSLEIFENAAKSTTIKQKPKVDSTTTHASNERNGKGNDVDDIYLAQNGSERRKEHNQEDYLEKGSENSEKYAFLKNPVFKKIFEEQVPKNMPYYNKMYSMRLRLE